MKKYSFRLETVRRVRRTEEDLAKAALAHANNEVQQAIAAVEARVAKYEETISLVGVGTNGVDAFMQRRFYADLASQAVVVARQSQAEAETQAVIKREAWSDIAKKVKALDRLDERRREEYRIELDRDTEKMVDDIVTSRYRREAR